MTQPAEKTSLTPEIIVETPSLREKLEKIDHLVARYSRLNTMI